MKWGQLYVLSGSSQGKPRAVAAFVTVVSADTWTDRTLADPSTVHVTVFEYAPDTTCGKMVLRGVRGSPFPSRNKGNEEDANPRAWNVSCSDTLSRKSNELDPTAALAGRKLGQ